MHFHEKWNFVILYVPYVPEKITIRLSASITFKVLNRLKYNFRLYNCNLFSAFCRKPHVIWSSSHTEMWIFIKYVTGPYLIGFAKCRITMHKNQFMLLLNDVFNEKEVTGLFYPQKVLCNTSFVSTINWFSSFSLLFFLLHINCISLGY